jgi:hypothetical protein
MQISLVERNPLFNIKSQKYFLDDTLNLDIRSNLGLVARGCLWIGI